MKKMAEKKTMKEWWQERSKNQKYLIIGGVILLGVFGGLINPKPEPCDCIGLLELKRNKMDYAPGMSNEDFRKWEKCYDAYAGPAGAFLKCGGK